MYANSVPGPEPKGTKATTTLGKGRHIHQVVGVAKHLAMFRVHQKLSYKPKSSVIGVTSRFEDAQSFSP